MVHRVLALLPLCLLLITASDLVSGDKKDQDKLQGTWQFVKFSGGGTEKEDAKKFKATFKGNKLTIIEAGKDFIKGTFTLDASKKPKTMDIDAEVDGKKHAMLAIYELKDDNLKVAHFQGEKGSKSRPTDFVGNDAAVVITLKRDK